MEHTFHYLVFTETEQYGDIYHKADADLVIAERDKVIEEQENLIADLIEKNKRLANKDMIMASETIKGICAELRLDKYKRSLDNVWWCLKLSNAYTWDAYTHRGWKIARYYDEKAELYRKWRKRWIKIAEQFKDA